MQISASTSPQLAAGTAGLLSDIHSRSDTPAPRSCGKWGQTSVLHKTDLFCLGFMVRETPQDGVPKRHFFGEFLNYREGKKKKFFK